MLEDCSIVLREVVEFSEMCPGILNMKFLLLNDDAVLWCLQRFAVHYILKTNFLVKTYM